MRKFIGVLLLLSPLALAAAETHYATLEVSVAENGRATNVKVLESTVSKEALDALVQDAVERGYAPEIREGRAVASTVIYSVEVSLQRKGARRTVALDKPEAPRACSYCPDARASQWVNF